MVSRMSRTCVKSRVSGIRSAVVLGMVMALALAACGSGNGSTTDDNGTSAESTDGPSPAADPDEEASSLDGLRVAALFGGVVTDSDFNALGFQALETLEEMGAETAYSESISSPDADRVMREYIDLDFNVIWSRVLPNDAVFELAEEFPDVTFIIGQDNPVEDVPGNVWMMNRRFHVPMYPIAVVAGNITQTGKIGYIGGPRLPFTFSEVRAIRQALDEQSIDAELVPVWAGDFNDPVVAKQIADELLSQDVDVLIGSINLGMLGIFTAVTSQAPGEAWVIGKYTDKLGFAPQHFVTSSIYNFSEPLSFIASQIAAGETTGYYELGFGEGMGLRFPLENLPEGASGLEETVQDIIQQIQDGEIEVVKDETPIED